ncbi:acyl-CoA dehydrogenase family protein [Phenylobacterium sp.]|uniref:acyl-CoA dehydrogenase family protein n=1 Tax=Phenylobacterium sp. TaxID=1871053 RepID=UPI0027347B3F|nr:acyl-CoA dehydrogenase family protein [Phenylobacterium sp.]MDP3658820.1 acyl-CoA dehydrogenase family protein [Phenylobacterium sp.]
MSQTATMTKAAGWTLWDLPFFEAEHFELAERMAAWARENVSHHDPKVDLAKRARKLVRAFGDAGFLKHVVPPLGQGVDARSVCLLREAIAYQDVLADDMFTMQGIGAAAVARLGTPEQQAKYLAPCRDGTMIAALALTEAKSGSDVASTATTATRDGDSFVINGEKAYISNAGLADFYVTVARTGEAPGARGLSVFMVDADTKGLKVGPPMDLIAEHPIAAVSFVDCRVPASAMIGQPGQGFRAAMGTLDVFRPSVGAAAVGAARRALAETLERLTNREMFGDKMSKLAGVQSAVADMACDIEVSALAVYRAAWGQDKQRGRPSYEASMAKLVATEAAGRVIDRAVQLFGGMGVTQGSIIERLYREVRPMRIYEGASEVQKLIIGRDMLNRAAKP